MPGPPAGDNSNFINGFRRVSSYGYRNELAFQMPEPRFVADNHLSRYGEM